MRVLSLFSGGGLGDYGLELAGMEIVGQVEINDYCQKILKLRWPDVLKWRDIRDVKGKEIKKVCGTIDLISGGFPCQPFSVAGKQRGAEDERNLWPEMLRVVSEVRPTWVLAENVPGIMGYLESVVLPDLEGQGYEVMPPLVFPAHAVGAPHRRDRVWIVADTRCKSKGNKESRFSRESEHGKKKKVRAETRDRFTNCGEAPCDTASERFPDRREESVGRSEQKQESQRSNWWSTEPGVGRVAHGVASRVDRLKLLGNGQVVQVVEWIGKRIIEFDASHRV